MSALVVYITFFLGKKQSDSNWIREIRRREKERKEDEAREILIRQITILDELISQFKGLCYYRVTQHFYNNSNILLDGNEIHKIQNAIMKTQVLFQNQGHKEVYFALDKLLEFTYWTLTESPQDEYDRKNIINSIFEILENKYQELEKIRFA